MRAIIIKQLLTDSFTLRPDQWSNGTHRGTFILALSDFLVNISFYHVAYQAALHHRVPSRHICLIEGFTNHTLCTLEFLCLVMIAVDRLAALRAISDGKRATKKSFRVLFLVWAGCFLHAAMPFISDYGYYDIGEKLRGAKVKSLSSLLNSNSSTHIFTRLASLVAAPSGYHCYGHGGKGVASHDVFTVMNVVYFLVCFAILIYQFWHSNKIIKRLAEPSLNEKELLESGKAGTLRGRSSKENKRLKLIKFHKESLLLSVVLVTGFLAAWGALGTKLRGAKQRAMNTILARVRGTKRGVLKNEHRILTRRFALWNSYSDPRYARRSSPLLYTPICGYI